MPTAPSFYVLQALCDFGTSWEDLMLWPLSEFDAARAAYAASRVVSPEQAAQGISRLPSRLVLRSQDVLCEGGE